MKKLNRTWIIIILYICLTLGGLPSFMYIYHHQMTTNQIIVITVAIWLIMSAAIIFFIVMTLIVKLAYQYMKASEKVQHRINISLIISFAIIMALIGLYAIML